MRQIILLKKKIKELLKKVLVVLLLLQSITGCMSAPVKRKTEVWFIDKDTAALYRVISDDSELVIPIEKNEAVEKFMCISKDEFKDIVEDTINAKAK